MIDVRRNHPGLGQKEGGMMSQRRTFVYTRSAPVPTHSN